MFIKTEERKKSDKHHPRIAWSEVQEFQMFTTNFNVFQHIAQRMTNYDWPFGTLPFGLFWSNLATRDLETYPRNYSGHF